MHTGGQHFTLTLIIPSIRRTLQTRVALWHAQGGWGNLGFDGSKYDIYISLREMDANEFAISCQFTKADTIHLLLLLTNSKRCKTLEYLLKVTCSTYWRSVATKTLVFR